MKQHLKKHFSFSDVIIIVVNLLAVWGAWIGRWSPYEIFLVYCLESVIVGCFTIVKMLLTTAVKRRDVWQNQGSNTMMPGLFFVFFFIIHFGIFITVQMNIFFGTVKLWNAENAPAGVVEFLFHFPKYLSTGVTWLLVSFAVSYAFQTLKDFVFSGVFKTASIGMLMFQPYPRIFVQQFTVIIGSFLLLMGAGKIFILVFALIKIFFEVMIDYDKIFAEKEEKVSG